MSRRWLLLLLAPLLMAHDSAPSTGIRGGGSGGGGGTAGITTGDTVPVTDCAVSGGCMFIEEDGSGNVTGLYCATNGEPYTPCTPGLSSGEGTATPTGTVDCEEAACLYFETDAEIMWVSWTAGSGSWEPLYTQPLRREYRFFMLNFATASQNAKCFGNVAGSAPLVCTTTTNFGTHVSGFPMPRVGGGTRLKRIACNMTIFTGEKPGDSLLIQAQERNGVAAVNIITNGLTIDDLDATGTVVTIDLDEPFSLTGNVELELKITATDIGPTITEIDFAWCDVLVEF